MPGIFDLGKIYTENENRLNCCFIVHLFNYFLETNSNGVSGNSSHGTTVQHDPSKDDVTVFLSNLDYSTEEYQVKDLFSCCGEIVTFRLVRDFKGRSKGYGYMEFSNKVRPNDNLVILVNMRCQHGTH